VVAIVALAGVGWFGFVAPAATQGLKALPQGTLPTSVTVTATSTFSYVVSTNELAVNSNITVTFVDTVATPHTFTLSSVQGVAIPQAIYGDNVTDYFAKHPAYASVQLNGIGQTTINFTSPPTGWYEFVCEIPGHFALNMYNALGFGVPAPSNLTGGAATIQVGWPVYVIAGTIVGLVILALVLGFVVGQRKGSRHEMPPERLGYPEEAPPSAGGGPIAPSPPLPPGPPPKTP
jgi:plastocyanin